MAQRSNSCKVVDDKNWLVVDNGARSPHRGRVYQFWTSFLFADEAQNQYIGGPQAVRWSDDRGPRGAGPTTSPRSTTARRTPSR